MCTKFHDYRIKRAISNTFPFTESTTFSKVEGVYLSLPRALQIFKVALPKCVRITGNLFYFDFVSIGLAVLKLHRKK